VRWTDDSQKELRPASPFALAAEALINGLPVLASDRGALPETLLNAGFLFHVPERYAPQTCSVPTAEEIAPWVETIISVWDDANFYDTARQRCLATAEAWSSERLVARYEEFLVGSSAPQSAEVGLGAANMPLNATTVETVAAHWWEARLTRQGAEKQRPGCSIVLSVSQISARSGGYN
jgi:hypothetical protein